MDLFLNSAVGWDAFDGEEASAAGVDEIDTVAVGLISVDGPEFEPGCVDCVTD